MEVVLRDIQNVLQYEFGDLLIVENFSTKSLIPPGENYNSTILSVTASIKKDENSEIKTINLVAKMIPTSSPHSFLHNCIIFKKEIFFYTEILPCYKNLEMEFNIKENLILNIGPKFYGSRLSSNPEVEFNEDAVILLENLQMQGYYTGERKIGLDLDHAEMAIRAMAKFHAMGMALKYKRPNKFEIFKLESKHPEIKSGSFQGIRNSLENALFSDPVISQYSSKLEPLMKMKPDFFSVAGEPWTTIIHSDFWINNIMFHKNFNGKIDDIKIIDYQNYIFQSAIRDLIFFICTSIISDLIPITLESLLDLYYETLISILKRMDCDVSLFSRDEFDKKVKSDAKKEFMHSTFFSIIQTIDIEKDVMNMTDMKSMLENYVPNELFFDKMRKITILFVDRDWI